MDIIYSKDDPKFANDLSFMSEEDWRQWEAAYAEKRARMSQRTTDEQAPQVTHSETPQL